MLLTSSLSDLHAHDVDIPATFLGPHLHLDALLTSAPFILVDENSGTETWLVKHQEKGAVEASRAFGEKRVAYFSPYMLLEDTAADIHSSLVEAVRRLAMDETLSVDSSLPLLLADPLGDDIRLVSNQRETGSQRSADNTRIDKSAILETFANSRAKMAAAAKPLIAENPRLEPLSTLAPQWATDTRFDDLDHLLAESGVDAVLATSAINQEELCAYPENAHAVLYRRGQADVAVIHEDVCETLAELGVRDLLVEEKDLGIGLAQTLRQAGVQLHYGSVALAKWRERRDYPNVHGLIVVAQASQQCMDDTIRWLEEQIADDVALTEHDVEAYYLRQVEHFSDRIGPACVIEEFFTNCHCGNRTIHPALDTDFAVDKATTTLKIDAGLKLKVDGLTLATSDIARTYCGNKNAARAYAVFMQIVNDTIANHIKPGEKFSAIHARVVASLVDRRDELNALGFWPADIDFSERYSQRNVGHLMGRQESFSSEFRPGDDEVIQNGDFGACEIQWPINGHSIGAENMWLVTPAGTLFLTQ